MQMLDRELVQPHEPVARLTSGIGVEVLERAAVGEQVGVGLARRERRVAQLTDPAGLHRLSTSGSARNAAARSLSSRYIRMLAAADSHTPAMSSVRDGL